MKRAKPGSDTTAPHPKGDAAQPRLHRCAICGREFPMSQLRSHHSVRQGVSDLIRQDHPGWREGQYICLEDNSRYRRKHLEELLEEERGELSDLDRAVIHSLDTNAIMAQNPEDLIEETETFGERMADHVATFGGSWTFILLFSFVLVAWMALNSAELARRPFDPYPFILLNLVLSTLAAIQAPVIMMSQKRQESKDRVRAENDYKVNLKAELEIRQLHEKIDSQMSAQWERLSELQRLQIEALEAATPAQPKQDDSQ